MIGQTLGHYKILELLGKGGMGEVYLAEDTKLQRRVALKMLTSAVAEDADRRQRFEREARAAAAFNHPNIVTIHSVEEVGGVPFLTLELIDGQTMASVIPTDGLPLDRVLALAIPLADAIGAAHQRGITHRDLKPANVMVTADGRVKVLDFGLAKLKEDARAEAQASMPTHELTGEGRILGTAAYMSPEQAEGKAVDSRTDVFALGVLLYEMATGARPFKGDTQMSLLSAIIKDTPAPISELRRDMPRDFTRIVQRCLAKDPDDRYQTAKDLRNDLRALKEDLTSGELTSSGMKTGAVVPPPAAVPAWKQPAMIGAGLAALAAVVAAAMYMRPSPGGPATAAAEGRRFDSVSLTRLTTTGTAGVAALSADGRYAAYVVADGRNQSLWLRQVTTSSNVQVVPPTDTRYDGVSFSPDSDYIYYVVYPLGANLGSLFQVPVLGGGSRKLVDDIDTAPSFSPDGKRFAFIRGFPDTQTAAVMLANADGGSEQQLTVSKEPLNFGQDSLAWSPDGKVIAVSGRERGTLRSRVVLVDAASGQQTPLGAHDWRAVTYLAWAGPDTLLVNAVEASGESSGQIWALAYPGGDLMRITNDLSTYSGLSVSGDGRSFVTVRNELRARIWSAPGGHQKDAHEITSGAGTDDGVEGLAWTPDGRLVYSTAGGGNSDIWIMKADGSNRVQLTATPEEDTLPVVAPDGSAIIFISERDSSRTLWRMNVDGSNQVKLGAGRVSYRPTVSFDSQWVYYSDPDRKNFRIAIGGGTPEPLLEELTAGGRSLPPAFHEPTPSPDGRAIAGHYQDDQQRAERMVVLSLDPGQGERRFPNVPPNARWAPDGKSLIYTGGTNLWRQPIGGGPPTQITTFTGDRLFSFAVSNDQKLWALVRGQVSSDVVLVANRPTR